MACPLFMPGSLLPLSDIYAGGCAANSAAILSTEKLARCCNPGYARTLCEEAAAAEADSYRFLVRSDDGSSIEVAWATERNHHPIAVGTLHIGRVPNRAVGPLEHQARVCAQAYLYRTGRDQTGRT
jgi:hypothetical protein